MKKLLPLCFMLLVFYMNTNAQSDTSGVFIFVDEMPEFPGGDVALLKFLQQNIRYPTYERDNDIQGRVIVRFTVDTNGKCINPEITRNVSPGLDSEAIRVIKMLPPFKPGRQQGKPVLVYYNLPIVFKLQHESPKPQKKSKGH